MQATSANSWFLLLLSAAVFTSWTAQGFTVQSSFNNQCIRDIRLRSFELCAKSGTKKKKLKSGTIAVNRIAYRNYEVLETMTAGVSLLGTEVKAIRDGKMNLRDGFCKPDKYGHCFLHNVHIGQHTGVGAYFQHDETRIRTLLINKSEARKLNQRVDQKGMTVVPLKAYFNDKNICKIEIGLCRGKNVRDKRDSIREREDKRDANRIIKSFRIG